jgi:hypothetical protein
MAVAVCSDDYSAISTYANPVATPGVDALDVVHLLAASLPVITSLAAIFIYLV